ncbi:MAG: hypothetical protein ACJAQX_001555, partial [Polaribacter sp.]
MKKLVILSMFVFYTVISNSNTDSYALTIKTEDLKNSEGTMVFALYNKDGSIPDQKFKKYFRKKHTTIVHKKAE